MLSTNPTLSVPVGDDEQVVITDSGAQVVVEENRRPSQTKSIAEDAKSTSDSPAPSAAAAPAGQLQDIPLDDRAKENASPAHGAAAGGGEKDPLVKPNKEKAAKKETIPFLELFRYATPAQKAMIL